MGVRKDDKVPPPDTDSRRSPVHSPARGARDAIFVIIGIEAGANPRSPLLATPGRPGAPVPMMPGR